MSVINNLSIEKVYDKIATHFDTTRYSVWEYVKIFIDKFDSYSKVLEIGCGNGKNMLYRTDLNFYGIDISEEQVKICNNKELNVQKANMISLPFNNSEFDKILCIATYHHLDNDKDRKLALYEMHRVLQINGKVLITVWAMEQESNSIHNFKKSNEMVPWKCKEDKNTYLRYYHIYKEGELEEEISRLCPEFKKKEVKKEKGNWCIILEK